MSAEYQSLRLRLNTAFQAIARAQKAETTGEAIANLVWAVQADADQRGRAAGIRGSDRINKTAHG